MGCEHKHHGHNSGCGQSKHHHHGKQCCHGEHFGPNIWTKAEKIAYLQERLQALQAEANAVAERIDALEKE